MITLMTKQTMTIRELFLFYLSIYCTNVVQFSSSLILDGMAAIILLSFRWRGKRREGGGDIM